MAYRILSGAGFAGLVEEIKTNMVHLEKCKARSLTLDFRSIYLIFQ